MQASASKHTHTLTRGMERINDLKTSPRSTQGNTLTTNTSERRKRDAPSGGREGGGVCDRGL